ncbi:hypothetical protein D3C87_1854450 [compost metagenome]|jgi:hypothetical protein
MLAGGEGGGLKDVDGGAGAGSIAPGALGRDCEGVEGAWAGAGASGCVCAQPGMGATATARAIPPAAKRFQDDRTC